jgi:hypothetical protein
MAVKSTQPPSDFSSATPQFFAQIHPRDGGSFILTSGNPGIIQVEIRISVQQSQDHSFSIDFTPGGPIGPDDASNWSYIIPPFSLVILYAQRGQSQRVIMIGLTSIVQEAQIWTPRGVTRGVRISGFDFSLYFKAFSYYELTYLGLLQAVEKTLGAAGYIFQNFGGISGGYTPSQFAYIWLAYVMLGVGNPANLKSLGLPNVKAVLQNTFVTYNKNPLFIKDFIGLWIEPYTEGPSTIPILSNFFNSEGSWFDKFYSILPWPFYEVFVITGTANMFSQMSTINSATINQQLTQPGTIETGYAQIPTKPISIPGFDDTFPIFVGRVNPLPWTEIHANAQGVQTSLEWHSKRWNNLPLFDFTGYGFLDSRVVTSTEDIRNFYAIISSDTYQPKSRTGAVQPTAYALEQWGGLWDRNSIANYGFLPQIESVMWFTLLNDGNFNSQGFPLDGTRMLPMQSKLASYYEPSPNMLHGDVTINFWPEVYPGTRFQYFPYKSHNSNDIFMFYIEGVQHNFVFGGRSTTTLNLTRGVRANNYADDNLMNLLHTGAVTRKDGVLTPRTNLVQSASLQYFQLQNLNPMMSPFVTAANPASGVTP